MTFYSIWLNSFSFPEMLGKDSICSTLLCLFSFVSARGERDQVTASVLQPAMYVPLNSFFFPSQECLIGKGFYLSNSFVLVSLSSGMVKGSKSQPPCSSLPTIYHWTLSLPSQECFIGMIWLVELFRVCLFVCLSLHIVEWMKSQPLCLHAAKHVPFPSPNVVFYWQYVWVHWCEL